MKNSLLMYIINLFTDSSISSLMQAVQSFPTKYTVGVGSLTASAPSVITSSSTSVQPSKCNEVSSMWAPCLCTLEMW